MNNRKAKIEFHPRRLSYSKSKDKYSPYRKQRSKQKYAESAENFQKINLQEPIIKFKNLLDHQTKTSKLKLCNDQTQQLKHTCTTHFSNYFYNTPQTTNQQNTAIQQLIQKIDQQHESMKQNFNEINQKLKLPKISQKEEIKSPQVMLNNYENLQEKIVQNLEELSKVKKENSQLKALIHIYQVQISSLKEELETSKNQCLWLLQQLSVLKMAGLVESQEIQISKKTNLEDKKTQSDHPSSKQVLLNKIVSYQDRQKNQKNKYEQIIKKKDEELTNLKLQNEVLSEEIKLLNYNIKEKKIQPNFGKVSLDYEEYPQILISGNKITFENIELNPSDEHSEVENVVLKQTFRTKKTNSLLMPEQQTLKQIEDLSMKYQRKPNRRRTSKDNDKEVNDDRRSLRGQKGLNKFNMSFDLKNKHSQMDKHKIDMGKSFLKNKAKQITESKKNKFRWAWHFDPSNMRHLQVIRNSIGYKLRGFRYTFSDLESQLMNSKKQSLSTEEIKKYLEQTPFLLSDHLISVFKQYIFKNNSEMSPKIKVDDFCKYLKQFVPDYHLCPEEQEKIAVQKITMLIESSCQELTTQFERLCQTPGIISHNAFKAVLKQFKMGDTEIQLITSQCCMISSDCQHLNYEQYFLLFLEDSNTQHSL